MQPIAARQWSAGFLPSRFQGVKFNSTGDPVLYISNPRGVMPRHAAGRRSTRSTRSTGSQTDALDDPEIADAHRAVRDGVPDADERARS